MAAPYIGNQDFRGYLNYLGTQGDATAKTLITGGGKSNLGYANNNGQLTNSAFLKQNLIDANSKYYQQYQGLNNIGSIYGGGAPTVYAPRLDVAAINANARQSAQNAVNPLYTQKLNEFLTQQGVLKKQKQTQYNTDVQNLQDNLANTLQGNETTRTRTGEDVALNESQINNQADQLQSDTGTQFEDQRLADARAQATAGTLGTGAGNRATSTALTTRNTQETRQEEKFQESRNQQELFKGRTLEDLLKSDTQAKISTEKGKKQTKFDLDNYLQGLSYNEKVTRNELESDRQKEIDAKASKFALDQYNTYIRNISNPAQRLAAAQQYGSSF